MALLCLVGIAGCEPSAGPGKQELVVAVGADESGLLLNRNRLGRYPLNAGICEPLVRLNADFALAPALATRWEYRGDNTYRFILRNDVRFHDGSRLDASTARRSLELGIDDRTQYSFLSRESIRVIDDTTLDIRPSIPNLRVLEQVVHPTYGIVAKAGQPSTHPVCTGAFRFAEYVPNRHLSMVRNDTYWGPKAKLDRVTFRFIPDDNTRALALRAGEVDLIVDVNQTLVAGLKATPGITISTAPTGAVMLIYIVTNGKPPHTRMSELAVRRAVALAIDRKSLVERVMDGYATEINTVSPPLVLGKYPGLVRGIPHNVQEAERLLDSAGWKLAGGRVRSRNGVRLRLSLITQPGAVDRAVSQYIQAQLARVGIEVTVEDLDAGAYTDRLNSGKFDLDIEVPNQNDANPAFLLALRWYSRSNVRSAAFTRASARFDSLIDEALASADRDTTQRKAAEAMHVLVDQDVAAIPLAGIYRIYAMNSKVKDFDAHPSRITQSWTSVRIAR